MATFVHLAPESALRGIRRGGLRARGTKHGVPDGVFAMPVTPSFVVSHQWLREMKRWKDSRTFWGVYFRVKDDEPVWVGRYDEEPRRMTAAQAVALFFADDDPPLDLEVVIPRSIATSEIHRYRAIPKAVGWRYFPGAHGRRPCGCPACQYGTPGTRRLREQYEARFRDGESGDG